MNITKQTSTTWTDEAGQAIPANRLTKSEKLREIKAYNLAKEAYTLNGKLAAFKAMVRSTCNEVVDAIRAENNVKTDSKGNFTWFNFGRSIKVEVNVSEAIKFDETLIDAAKVKLLEIIDENVKADDFIKSIINDAFTTTSGQLDTSRVLGLKKHTSRIKNPDIKAKWEQAMELIDKSISRPSSKQYFRISVRKEDGSYENIDLNFSSI